MLIAEIRLKEWPTLSSSAMPMLPWRRTHEPGRETPLLPAAMRAPSERPLPLLAEGTDIELERPSTLRLLVELPVGGRDGCRRHQQIRIVERLLAPELLLSLSDPGGIDAGIDDEMRNMDVLRSELARHRLRYGTQSELGGGKGRKTTSTAQGRS